MKVTQKTFLKRMEAFDRISREQGLKFTHQRIEIFREIAGVEDHPSAEKIHKRIQSKLPTISLDTVYRTLATFAHYGLIKKVEFLDDRSRFDANLKQHHHFVCTCCRCVEDFYWPAFDEMKLPDDTLKWGRLQSKHIEIRGICRQCLEEKK